MMVTWKLKSMGLIKSFLSKVATFWGKKNKKSINLKILKMLIKNLKILKVVPNQAAVASSPIQRGFHIGQHLEKR